MWRGEAAHHLVGRRIEEDRMERHDLIILLKGTTSLFYLVSIRLYLLQGLAPHIEP